MVFLGLSTEPLAALLALYTRICNQNSLDSFESVCGYAVRVLIAPPNEHPFSIFVEIELERFMCLSFFCFPSSEPNLSGTLVTLGAETFVATVSVSIAWMKYYSE